jgi:hypothetical protein
LGDELLLELIHVLGLLLLHSVPRWGSLLLCLA